MKRLTTLTLLASVSMQSSTLTVHVHAETNQHKMPVEEQEITNIESLVKQSKLDEALQRIDLEMQKNINNDRLHFLRGRVMQEMRNNTEALASYSISIFLNDSNTKALTNRALTRGALGDIDGALRELDRAIEIDPKNAPAYMNRGVTYAGLNQRQKALQEFTKAISLDQNYAEAYRNRGIVKHYLNDNKGACSDWRLASLKGDRDTKEWLGFFCKETNRQKSVNKRR